MLRPQGSQTAMRREAMNLGLSAMGAASLCPANGLTKAPMPYKLLYVFILIFLALLDGILIHVIFRKVSKGRRLLFLIVPFGSYAVIFLTLGMLMVDLLRGL